MVIKRALGAAMSAASIWTPDGDEIRSDAPLPPGFESRISAAAAEALRSQVSKALGAIEKSAAQFQDRLGVQSPASQGPETAPSGYPADFDPNDPGATVERASTDSEGPEEEPDTRPISQRFREARGQGKQATASSVFKATSGAVAARLSEQDFQRYSMSEDNRTVMENIFDDDGNQIGQQVLAEKGSPGFTTAMLAARYGKPLTTGLGRIASGQALTTAGVLGTAARFAGPIGLAVGGTMAAGSFVESQIEAGAEFRRVYGQDAGKFALEQRFDRTLAGLSGFGTIGSDRATKIYNQAAGMGLTGQRLDSARGFASDLYMDLGLETSESMEAVRLSVNSANLSLGDLKERMLEVSESAVAAGRNAAEANKEFLAVVGGLERGVSTNNDANTATAQVVQGIADSMPRDLKGVSGALAGLITDSNLSRVANATGVDTRDLIRATRVGDSTTNLSTIASIGDQIVQAVTGMSAAQFRQRLPENVKSLSAAEQFDLLTEMDIDPRNISVIFRSFGLSVNPAQEVPLFFQLALGSVSQGVSDGIKTERVAQAVRVDRSGLSGDRDALNEKLGYTSKDLFGMPLYQDPEARGDDYSYYDSSQDFVGQYQRLLERSDGKGGNKAIEALIGKDSVSEIKDFANVDTAMEAKFQVEGKGGEKATANLAQLVRNPEYRRQVAEGSAVLLGENGQRQRVSELTGFKVNPNQPRVDRDGEKFTLTLTGLAERVLKRVIEPDDSRDTGAPAPGRIDPRDYGGD